MFSNNFIQIYFKNRVYSGYKKLPWNIIFSVGIFLLCFGNNNAQTCKTPFVQYPKMGVNAKFYFVDLAFNARYEWGTYASPYDGKAPLDKDGWPLTDAGNYFVEGAPVEPGVYNLEFECNNPTGVTIDRFVTAFTVSNRTVNGNIVRAQLTIPANTTSREFTIKFGNTNGGVRKVRLLLPGYSLDTDLIIDPRYINLMAPYSNFRFMDGIKASGNPDKEWSQRTLPGQGGQASRKNGVAYEYMIELCNRANKDMWMNVPVRASDDYIRNLAKLLKDKLSPNLIIHLELGNEIWNSGGGFWGLHYMVEGVNEDYRSGNADKKTIFGGQFGIPAETGNAAVPNGQGFSAWSALQYRIARRLKEIVEIFGEVYGPNEINNKIRGILCGQIGYAGMGHGFNIGPGLEYINAYYGDPSKYFYAVGVAPYYGGGPTNSMTVDQIIDLANKDIDCRYEKIPTRACQPTYDNGNQLEGMIAKAKRYNLKIFAYEGAPDMDYTTGFGGPDSPKSKALKDPRMKDMAIKFWKNWFSWCGPDALFNYYSGGISKDFTWIYAMVEDITNSTNAPTFAGVKQVLSEPAPLLTGGHQIFTNPTITTFRAVEVAGYSVNNYNSPALQYIRSPHKYDYILSVNQNGRYALSFEYNGAGTIDLLIDGKKVQAVTLPSKGNFGYSTSFELDLYYGIHALTLNFTTPGGASGSAVSLRNLRFEYKNIKYPPKAPDAILAAQANVCLASNNQKYDVKTIDPSACYYKWILPSTATFTGDNTPNIVVDWKNTPVGTYTIKLIAGNDDGWSDTTRQEIKISNCGIDASNLRPCVGEAVTFTDLTINSTSWLWDFGPQSSPATSNLKVPPTVSYGPLEGSKTIKLMVKEDGVDKIYNKLITVVHCNSPIVNNITYCLNQISKPLTAQGTNGGTNFKWYKDPTGGSPIPTPIPSTSEIGITSYYVSQENGGVESKRTKLDVTVTDGPSKPTVDLLPPFCKGGSANITDIINKVTVSPGATLKWYEVPTGGETVLITVPDMTVGGTKSWYVSQSVGTCESPRATMTVTVAEGPTFTLEKEDPVSCKEKGKLILKGLTPNSKYKVSYNTPAISEDSTANANGEIALNLSQGSYTNIKVDNGSCSSTLAGPYEIIEPSAPEFTVHVRQPKECGALGALALKGLVANTSYQISYNGRVEEVLSSKGDSLVIALRTGTYKDIKVSLGKCSSTNPQTYTLLEKEMVPPAEQTGPSTYCQNQRVAITDLTSRVKGDPAYTLRWYATENSNPTTQPSPLDTKEPGTKSIFVSQVNLNNCESSKLKLNVVVNPSSILSVTGQPPSACGQSDGKLIITGLQNIVNYKIEYKREDQSQPEKIDFSNEIGNLFIENLPSGNYSSVTVTPVSGNNCLTNSEQIITLPEPGAPTAPVISGDRNYCSTETIGALAAVAKSGGAIEWYDTAPTPESTPLSIGSTYTPEMFIATKTFYAVENVGGCKSPASSASISIVASPAVRSITGEAGPASCNGTGYDLKLNTELGVNYILYKDNEVTSLKVPGEGREIILSTLSVEGAYTVKAETAINNCKADMSGSMIIESKVDPLLFTVGGGGTGCEGTIHSAIITLSGSESNVTYILSSGESQDGTGSPLTFVKEAILANNNNYTIIARNKLTDCTIEMSGSGVINIQGDVTAPVILAEEIYCNKGQSTIGLQVSNATSSQWTLTPENAGIIDAGGIVMWNSRYTGPVTIGVSVRNEACNTEEKSAVVEALTISVPELSSINGDSLVCRGTDATYTALPKSASITYEWAINSNVNIMENSQGVFTIRYNEDIGESGNTLIVTPVSEHCGKGSPVHKTIFKDPGCDLFVPNVLTVNGDVNSGWQIEGVENYPKLNIQVFNRWGGLVHSHKGRYDKPWDGTMNGNPLPTATYYYVIDKEDGSRKITGSITVIK